MKDAKSAVTAHVRRIDSIDALRGCALIGILLWHCMERFDLGGRPVLDDPFWQWVDTAVLETFRFLFQGKAYAVFSLLFGLSFFIQMDSQAAKGNDFRLRFLWRMAVLLLFGYVNGLVYMGEFFVIYALLGIVLVPLWKVPSRVLWILCGVLFLQIPQLTEFISLLLGHAPNEPTALNVRMNELFGESYLTFTEGSLSDMLEFNSFAGQSAKIMWFVNVYRYLQLVGLFIVGLLIGRAGIHKSPEKMVRVSKRAIFPAVAVAAMFYTARTLLPRFGVDGYALDVGRGLFKMYGDLGLMITWVGLLTLLYHCCRRGRFILDRIAPVGRMSVTNYMMQSVMGALLFYGFGLGLYRESFLVGAVAGAAAASIQILYSNWWIGRFHYGPMEWLWRTLTWFRRIPIRRQVRRQTAARKPV